MRTIPEHANRVRAAYGEQRVPSGARKITTLLFQFMLVNFAHTIVAGLAPIGRRRSN